MEKLHLWNKLDLKCRPVDCVLQYHRSLCSLGEDCLELIYSTLCKDCGRVVKGCLGAVGPRKDVVCERLKQARTLSGFDVSRARIYMTHDVRLQGPDNVDKIYVWPSNVSISAGEPVLPGVASMIVENDWVVS